MYGLQNRKVRLYKSSDKTAEIADSNKDLSCLNGSPVFVYVGDNAAVTPTRSPSGNGPMCHYVNVELAGKSPSGGKGTQATVLLENPCGDYMLSMEGLKRQVSDLLLSCEFPVDLVVSLY